MADYIQLFTTTEKRDDAEIIAREVVKKRLASCAQVVGPIKSTYWWKEKIEQTEEWLCIMKSRSDLYDELEEAIKNIHPYEVPEIVAVPIVSGSQSYLEWLDNEVRSSRVKGG
jgi:periplasmic divalent cation tolerance protein